MIVVKTPHRISLFGGGTDYPAWFQKHGGEVIAGAIDKYCYLTVRELPPFFDHKYRLV
jgi:D-glycero-alpha-D-manno-heptose-7-phosphate kinase